MLLDVLGNRSGVSRENISRLNRKIKYLDERNPCLTEVLRCRCYCLSVLCNLRADFSSVSYEIFHCCLTLVDFVVCRVRIVYEKANNLSAHISDFVSERFDFLRPCFNLLHHSCRNAATASFELCYARRFGISTPAASAARMMSVAPFTSTDCFTRRKMATMIPFKIIRVAKNSFILSLLLPMRSRSQ